MSGPYFHHTSRQQMKKISASWCKLIKSVIDDDSCSKIKFNNFAAVLLHLIKYDDFSIGKIKKNYNSHKCSMCIVFNTYGRIIFTVNSLFVWEDIRFGGRQYQPTNTYPEEWALAAVAIYFSLDVYVHI